MYYVVVICMDFVFIVLLGPGPAQARPGQINLMAQSLGPKPGHCRTLPRTQTLWRHEDTHLVMVTSGNFGCMNCLRIPNVFCFLI